MFLVPGSLGFYPLFNDRDHTAITIYFLNQERPLGSKTMEEDAVMRGWFLNEYTACIRSALNRR
jgi:hypothetical protein